MWPCFRIRVLPLILALGSGVRAGAQRVSADILITGGLVYDGSGAAGRVADVGLRGDRIVFVGDAKSAGVTATRTIVATGLIVAPGFIDPHTHTPTDLSSPVRRGNAPYLMQGVTTVATNNDGGGATDVGPLLAKWDSAGIGTNALVYVPQGSVRGRVLGMSDRAPNAAELAKMEDIVERGMRDGAFGLSAGLYYAPGSYATTEEVIALAKVAARHGGIYDTHQRDESSYTIGLLGSVREVLRIGREAKIPVHFSHIKALGADVWGYADSVIALITAAQQEGITVSADQYPYDASGTSLVTSLLPRWAEAGGRDSLLHRIADPATHTKLVAEMRENLRRRGGASSLLVVNKASRELYGKRLDAIAATRKLEPVEAALEIIRTVGDQSVASFNMNARDIETFMKAPFVTTGSDGSDGHPRKYGSYPKKLREFVIDKPVLTMARAIEASSAQPAHDLGIPQRGKLEVGWFADVIVFDPATIRDQSTYTEPEKLATGMRWVFVNGKGAVDSGKLTGVLAGHALRHSSSAAPSKENK
ncbi:MAG: amidohydrolase family protein [Gemmatimonadetes bacterium]|nr:amidohydrolase family protein [Gemmatimonadota bacterium]